MKKRMNLREKIKKIILMTSLAKTQKSTRAYNIGKLALSIIKELVRIINLKDKGGKKIMAKKPAKGGKGGKKC